MGPLRSKTIKNIGKRGEPILESRVKEYREFLCKDGPIEAGEMVVVGIRGCGLELITSLPEVLENKMYQDGCRLQTWRRNCYCRYAHKS